MLPQKSPKARGAKSRRPPQETYREAAILANAGAHFAGKSRVLWRENDGVEKKQAGPRRKRPGRIGGEIEEKC